ncbi:hypothetical protein EDB19DRAFT_505591 [Suillus lakei]|nr:hypothetical protein EDB19DRAFT_505591 [Suillus lakei]
MLMYVVKISSSTVLHTQYPQFFARPHAHNTPSRLPLLHWARTTFPGRPRGAQIELAKVDVLYCQCKHKNAKAREKPRLMPLNSKNATASTSCPLSCATQASSQQQAVVFTSCAAPAIAATFQSCNFAEVRLLHINNCLDLGKVGCCTSGNLISYVSDDLRYQIKNTKL